MRSKAELEFEGINLRKVDTTPKKIERKRCEGKNLWFFIVKEFVRLLQYAKDVYTEILLKENEEEKEKGLKKRYKRNVEESDEVHVVSLFEDKAEKIAEMLQESKIKARNNNFGKKNGNYLNLLSNLRSSKAKENTYSDFQSLVLNSIIISYVIYLSKIIRNKLCKFFCSISVFVIFFGTFTLCLYYKTSVRTDISFLFIVIFVWAILHKLNEFSRKNDKLNYEKEKVEVKLYKMKQVFNVCNENYVKNETLCINGINNFRDFSASDDNNKKYANNKNKDDLIYSNSCGIVDTIKCNERKRMKIETKRFKCMCERIKSTKYFQKLNKIKNFWYLKKSKKGKKKKIVKRKEDKIEEVNIECISVLEVKKEDEELKKEIVKEANFCKEESKGSTENFSVFSFVKDEIKEKKVKEIVCLMEKETGCCGKIEKAVEKLFEGEIKYNEERNSCKCSILSEEDIFIEIKEKQMSDLLQKKEAVPILEEVKNECCKNFENLPSMCNKGVRRTENQQELLEISLKNEENEELNNLLLVQDIFKDLETLDENVSFPIKYENIEEKESEVGNFCNDKSLLLNDILNEEKKENIFLPFCFSSISSSSLFSSNLNCNFTGSECDFSKSTLSSFSSCPSFPCSSFSFCSSFSQFSSLYSLAFSSSMFFSCSSEENKLSNALSRVCFAEKNEKNVFVMPEREEKCFTKNFYSGVCLKNASSFKTASHYVNSRKDFSNNEAINDLNKYFAFTLKEMERNEEYVKEEKEDKEEKEEKEDKSISLVGHLKDLNPNNNCSNLSTFTNNTLNSFAEKSRKDANFSFFPSNSFVDFPSFSNFYSAPKNKNNFFESFSPSLYGLKNKNDEKNFSFFLKDSNVNVYNNNNNNNNNFVSSSSLSDNNEDTNYYHSKTLKNDLNDCCCIRKNENMHMQSSNKSIKFNRINDIMYSTEDFVSNCSNCSNYNQHIYNNRNNDYKEADMIYNNINYNFINKNVTAKNNNYNNKHKKLSSSASPSVVAPPSFKCFYKISNNNNDNNSNNNNNNNDNDNNSNNNNSNNNNNNSNNNNNNNNSNNNIALYNIQRYMQMIRVCSKNNDVNTAISILRKAKEENIHPDKHMYNYVLSVCVSNNDIYNSEKLFNEMYSMNKIDVVSYNTLLKLYAKNNKYNLAFNILNVMKKEGKAPDEVSFNSLIDAAVSSGKIQTAWKLIELMKKNNLTPDKYTISSMIKSLRSGMPQNLIKKILNLMDNINVCEDVILLATCIDACARLNDNQRLQYLLQSFKNSTLLPNAHTYGTLIKAYGRIYNIEEVRNLWNELISRKITPTNYTYGCMLDSLLNNNKIQDCVNFFKKMILLNVADSVHLSIVIKGLSKYGVLGVKEALHLYDYILQHDCSDENNELNNQCADHNCIIDSDNHPKNCGCANNKTLILTTISYNSLIHACANVGDMKSAERIFNQMKVNLHAKPDLITYSTLVKGFCNLNNKHAFSCASQLFKEMQLNKIRPDAIIFNTLIQGSACRMDVEMTEKLLCKMIEMNINPSSYTLCQCVKLHGRCHNLKRALELTDILTVKYNFKIDFYVYTCLIAACLHNNAPHIAAKLIEKAKQENLILPSDVIERVQKNMKNKAKSRGRKEIKSCNIKNVQNRSTNNTYSNNSNVMKKEAHQLNHKKCYDWLNSINKNIKNNNTHNYFINYNRKENNDTVPKKNLNNINSKPTQNNSCILLINEKNKNTEK